MANEWQDCLAIIKDEIPSLDFETCIRPLQAIPDRTTGNITRLLAPNRYIRDLIDTQFLPRIKELLAEAGSSDVQLTIGSNALQPALVSTDTLPEAFHSPLSIQKEYTFDTFVGGHSNELALAAARGVVEKVGASQYNPLLFYGGVGLGKTHLMHAVGNSIAERHPQLKVAYMYAQHFTDEMVRAIKQGTMGEFTEYYRAVDVLLMDDIQFLADRPKSQEEFFAVFNRMQLKEESQIVLTSDRYPNAIKGLEKRLESRFVWGMTAPLEMPELETRVAILTKKAELHGVELPNEVAFLLADLVRSNVRELEGALKRVLAIAEMKGCPVSLELTRESLRDLIANQARSISIDSIQKGVAEYYKIRLSDLHSKRRTRSITRPRQMAMALAKELTHQSLPEIGDSFGGRDHTTVLHACRKIEELRESSRDIADDYNNLLRQLTS